MNIQTMFTIDQATRDESVKKLLADSQPNADFYLLLILATLIVVPGLLLNNVSVVIGGMVVAPLLSPILSFGMGIVTADFKLIRRSSKTIMAAVLLAVAAGLIMSLFNSGQGLNAEITSRSSVSVAYLVVAIASGAAASFALIKPAISAAITGIAVSVALLPPIAVIGIGLSLGAWSLAAQAFALFAVNFIGIVFSSLVIFSLYGFSRAQRTVEKKLVKEEKELKQEQKQMKQQKQQEEQDSA